MAKTARPLPKICIPEPKYKSILAIKSGSCALGMIKGISINRRAKITFFLRLVPCNRSLILPTTASNVATIDKKNRIVKIIEKPKKTASNLAITGLYFFDNNVVKYSKSLKPSKRKEIEIVDLLTKYKNKNQLNAEIIGRGGAWLDTGSIIDFNNTSNFVAAIENRQGFKIGCIEEIAFNNKWINKANILNAMKFYGNCEYSKYLSLITNK
jgi:dTDP-glucose pyrophosphorylase